MKIWNFRFSHIYIGYKDSSSRIGSKIDLQNSRDVPGFSKWGMCTLCPLKSVTVYSSELSNAIEQNFINCQDIGIYYNRHTIQIYFSRYAFLFPKAYLPDTAKRAEENLGIMCINRHDGEIT